jgi:hypothetical protein
MLRESRRSGDFAALVDYPADAEIGLPSLLETLEIDLEGCSKGIFG